MPFMVDSETGEKPYSTRDDVAMTAKMAESLKQVAFYWPMVSAGDREILIL